MAPHAVPLSTNRPTRTPSLRSDSKAVSHLQHGKDLYKLLLPLPRETQKLTIKKTIKFLFNQVIKVSTISNKIINIRNPLTGYLETASCHFCSIVSPKGLTSLKKRMSFAAIWMDLEIILLSDVKDKYHDIVISGI